MFGELVRALRQQLAMTQEELAERAAVNVRTIRKLEADKINTPRPATVRQLADAFGLHGAQREQFYAGVACSVPRLDAGTPPPAQLPADVSDFTGRVQDLAALDTLVEAPLPTMRVAITGAAGVGKTALAVRWAHRIRRRFCDGQLYVNLRGYAPGQPMQPIEALAQFLYALGVTPQAVPVDVEHAAGLYRSLLADRRVLVLLDNARDAEQVRPLLPGGAGCLVLITSRDTLTGLVAHVGARRVGLDVLAAHESEQLITCLVGADRAAAEPQATAELAALCAGLPLALRIAAANLTAKPHQRIADYANELRVGDDRLATLVVNGDEHIGVRAAFDLSYTALSDDARRLFRYLSFVPGPDFTAALAAELLEQPPARVQRLLDRLLAAHLIRQDASGRYGYHDLLRLYAGDLAAVEADESTLATARIYDWYLRHCDAAVTMLCPQLLRLPQPLPALSPLSIFDDTAAALAWMNAERPNLVAATMHTATYGPHTMACLLADALRGYCWLRSHTVDWLTIGQAGLAAARVTGDLRAQTAALLSLGLAELFLCRYRNAKDHFTRALTLARHADWPTAEANALSYIGIAHTELEELSAASERLHQALAINRRIGETAREYTNLQNLTRVHIYAGRLREADEHLSLSLPVLRKLGHTANLATTLTHLGLVRHTLGELASASELLTEGVALHRQVGSLVNETWTLVGLARTHRDAGRVHQALETAQAAVTLAEQIQHRDLTSCAYNVLATVEHHLRRHRDARTHARHALDLARDTGVRFNQASALITLGAVHSELGDIEQALACAREALVTGRKLGFRVIEGQALTTLAQVLLNAGSIDEAAEYAQQALHSHEATGHRPGAAQTHIILREALKHSDEPTAEFHQRQAAQVDAEITRTNPR